MKFVYVLLLGLAAAPALASTNYIVNPAFDQGADGLDGWEGFEEATGQGIAPSNFVTASAGSALVRGYGTLPGNKAFYHTYTVASGTLPDGTYMWSAEITNLTDTAAEMFVKVWERDNDWPSWIGSKYQHPVLSNGLNIIIYIHAATNLAQFGFHCPTTNTTLGFDLKNPTLTLLSAGPSNVTARIARTPGAAPHVAFDSESGVSYTLEATADLTAIPVDWQTVETQLGTGGPLTMGTNAPAVVFRVFRIVTP